MPTQRNGDHAKTIAKVEDFIKSKDLTKIKDKAKAKSKAKSGNITEVNNFK